MRGAVNPALRAALDPAAIEPTQSDISSALYAIARDCRWSVVNFNWRPIHCTFHLCFVETPVGVCAIVAGGDAPVLALSRTSKINDELRYFDHASFGSAVAGYAPSMQVLKADDLKADLNEVDRSWLISLGPDMDYNLKYWRPRTIGEVIFNTWD